MMMVMIMMMHLCSRQGRTILSPESVAKIVKIREFYEIKNIVKIRCVGAL